MICTFTLDLNVCRDVVSQSRVYHCRLALFPSISVMKSILSDKSLLAVMHFCQLTFSFSAKHICNMFLLILICKFPKALGKVCMYYSKLTENIQEWNLICLTIASTISQWLPFINVKDKWQLIQYFDAFIDLHTPYRSC